MSKTRTIADVEHELAEVEYHIEPLRKRQVELQSELQHLISQQWIADHNMTRDQVEMSKGKGKPWFGHIRHFIDWLYQQSSMKPYAEWNDRIFLTGNLHGSVEFTKTPATIRELPD